MQNQKKKENWNMQAPKNILIFIRNMFKWGFFFFGGTKIWQFLDCLDLLILEDIGKWGWQQQKTWERGKELKKPNLWKWKVIGRRKMYVYCKAFGIPKCFEGNSFVISQFVFVQIVTWNNVGGICLIF